MFIPLNPFGLRKTLYSLPYCSEPYLQSFCFVGHEQYVNLLDIDLKHPLHSEICLKICGVKDSTAGQQLARTVAPVTQVQL